VHNGKPHTMQKYSFEHDKELHFWMHGDHFEAFNASLRRGTYKIGLAKFPKSQLGALYGAHTNSSIPGLLDTHWGIHVNGYIHHVAVLPGTDTVGYQIMPLKKESSMEVTDHMEVDANLFDLVVEMAKEARVILPTFGLGSCQAWCKGVLGKFSPQCVFTGTDAVKVVVGLVVLGIAVYGIYKATS